MEDDIFMRKLTGQKAEAGGLEPESTIYKQWPMHHMVQDKKIHSVCPRKKRLALVWSARKWPYRYFIDFHTTLQSILPLLKAKLGINLTYTFRQPKN